MCDLLFAKPTRRQFLTFTMRSSLSFVVDSLRSHLLLLVLGRRRYRIET